MTRIDWENITNYIDSVGTTDTVFPFIKAQSSVKVTTSGANDNIIYTIGGQSGTLSPGQNVTVTGTISSMTLRSASGRQPFQVWATEAGTEKDETDTSYQGQIDTLTTSLAQIVQQNKKNQTLYVSKDIGDFKTINDAVNYAKSQGVDRGNRWTIYIFSGTYNEKLDLAHGIDLIGENPRSTIINYAGTGYRTDDTIRAHYDCTLENLTIIQDATATTSDQENYPIHCDSGTGYFDLKIKNSIISALGNFSHHAIGFGLNAAQNVTIDNSEFHSDAKPALYLHNWNDQPMAVKLKVKNSKIYGCKTTVSTADNAGVLFEDLNSTQYDEAIFSNCEIATFQPNGYDIKLRKHPSFTGARNTLNVRLINCLYNNFSNETDSGKIVTDKDILCSSSALGINDYGKPALVLGQSNSIIQANKSSWDDSEHILGVFIPYAGGYGYIRTVGVIDIFADATVNAINTFDFLSSAATGYFKKGTMGTGKCIAVALENLSLGQTGYIKAQLVQRI